MGLLNNGITMIHFDDTYFAQRELQSYPHIDMDFRQVAHVNLYCEKDSLLFLKKQLQKRNQKGITFIGSGNYHYVSYLLLKEISTPFALVLFDNHPDLGTDEEQAANMLSCGTWVSYALKEIPLLEKVIIIGPTVILPNRLNQDPRVSIYPFDSSHQYSIKSILSAIHTKNVYISIDKDVLRREEVETNWDQGVMPVRTLAQFLEGILKNKNTEGIDICGEAHISPVEMVLPDYQAIIHKNEKANLAILQKCLASSYSHTRGA